MFEFFVKMRNRIHKDNKGLSIVTVVVAIGFVIILVNILLLTSTINFKMRNVNVSAKESFYSAETVLDEVRIGLQQLVSDGLSNAYSEVLTSYDTSDLSSDEKNEMVKTRFYNYIEDKLCIKKNVGGKDVYYYITMPVTASTTPGGSVDGSGNPVSEGLYAFVKESTRWHGDSTPADLSDDFGAFLRSANASQTDGTFYYGAMEENAKDGISLKDLVIYYRDSNGFVSSIKTDIRLVYPEFSFDNPVMPSISDYCFITDTALEAKYTGATRAYTTTVNGNSFAYAVDGEGVNLKYPVSPSGIATTVVATTMNLKNSSLTTESTSVLWADDIVAHSSDVDLDGYSYIQDDLNLKGTDSKMALKGYYIGYGNSINGSRQSSAILVNGKNTEIDLSQAKKLSLAGRAFIGTSSKSAKDKNKVTDDTDSTVEVYMGESISSKSNQLMYLVPAECIGVNLSNESKYNQNPLTYAQYEDIKNNPDLQMVSINKPVAKLGSAGNLLGEYINSDGYKTVFVRKKGGSDAKSDQLVYFYMKFKDEDAANLYFAKYYGLNKDSVDKYMEIYLKSLELPSSSDASLRVSLAGYTVGDNVDLNGDGVPDGERNTAASLLKSKGTEYTSITDSMQSDFNSYSEQFEGYCTKLTPYLDSLQGVVMRGDSNTVNGVTYPLTTSEDKADNKALFSNIINEDMLDEMTGTFEISGNKAILKKGDVTVTDSDVHLVVATGDVTLTGTSFEGTIIAAGKIIVPSNNFEFKPNKKKVDACMFIEDLETHVYTVADVFRDLDEVRYISTKTGKTDEYNVANLVIFENWSRSVDISKTTTTGP